MRSSVSHIEEEAPQTGEAVTPVSTLSRRPRIGELLVQNGVLSEEDVAKVLTAQAQTSRLFGEICVDLGLCSQDVVKETLDRQLNFHILAPGDERVSDQVVTAFGADPELAEGLRSLRAALLGKKTAQGDLNAILVMAGADEATPVSLIAANFAVVVAQLGYRVLLVDANVAQPVQHQLFSVANRRGVTTLLAGEQEEEAAISTTAIPNLALLPAGPPVPHPAELFERAPLATRLRPLSSRYDLVLIDAGTESPDIVASLASGSDGAVTVVKRHRTAIRQVRRLVGHFADRGVATLGNVLA
ncbi:hypothetical protein CLG96_07380 [Sphingomonas oleivorans]|uniref:Chain length determinant protein tyrosine kinase EpsG n=1 Tax=Sphingomonas oleivorans TaxID=1735121 RepID=A0A2T5G059_9SPHN|nr:hypothetical protein CLG96_07380 [Sphingomonas oleivorans]